MFCKLNYDFSKYRDGLIEIIDAGYFMGYNNGNLIYDDQPGLDFKRKGFYTNYIDDKNQYSYIFKNIIPDRYKDMFYLETITINKTLEPHTDIAYHEATSFCAINFYLEVGNYRTVFYKNLQNLNKTHKLSDITMRNSDLGIASNLDLFAESSLAQTFEYSNIEEIGSFVAKPYEAYLLDVSMIHSVETLEESVIYDEIKPRHAFRLSTDKYNYNEVYEMLKETECFAN